MRPCLPDAARLVPLLAALGACAQAPGPGGTGPGPGTGPTELESIPTSEVLQGIQIGEGGDALPCEAVLSPGASVDGLFDGLEGAWPDVPYDLDGQTGVVDLELVLDTTWSLSWVPYEGTASTFDCEGEPVASVASAWLRITDGPTVHDVPVFARTLDRPTTAFVGEAPGEALGLDGDAYDLQGAVEPDGIQVDVYTDLLYGTPVGTFGG